MLEAQIATKATSVNDGLKWHFDDYEDNNANGLEATATAKNGKAS